MSAADTAKLVFTPSGRRGEFPIGTPILQAAQQLGVDVESICGGRGLCGRCQVECQEGSFPKHGITSSVEHLNAFTDTERAYEKRRGAMADGRRLSCQSLLQGDLVIDVPPDSQVHKQIVRKEADLRDITMDTAVQLHYVTVQEADMHDPRGDLQRMQEALEKEWGLTNLSCDFKVLKYLQPTIREGEWAVTVAVYDEKTVMAVWPGFKDSVFGIACDVGSTTIAAHLCNLVTGEVLNSASMMNPQIRFGEDLMSRVSYVMMQPEGTEAMSTAVREGINQLIGEIVTEAEIERSDILEMTLVGNPIMHHLLLNVSPVELGGAPFALATDGAINCQAADLDLAINPCGRAYILPCIAGHVGADAAAVVLSEEPQLQDEITLLVDVGTNAEIVLGNKQQVLACSSPTGPAFEGAQISSGQRAAPGAIERVRIDPDTKQARFRVIGSELWSNEEGFDESAEQFGVTGICGSGIIEVVAEMYLAGIITTDGVIDGGLESTGLVFQDDRTYSYLVYENPEDSSRNITVTQNDVRQIQLAKAALYAGVKLLMDHMGVDHVERIRLAGAFGSHIDVKRAMVLGLIPDCQLEKVASAGNAAGTGARIALYNRGAREQIETTVKNIQKIETALEAKFQDYFVDAMAFPNKTDPFPQLFSVVTRPPEKVIEESASGDRARRRRRRR